MAAKKKPTTVLSVVSFRYAILLSFSILAILLHALLLQSYNFINGWLPLIKSAVQTQEESGIQLKVELNAEEISVSFDQTSMFVDIIVSYGELVLQGALPVERFYDSVHEKQGLSASELQFSNRIDSADTTFHEDTVLDNKHRTLSSAVTEAFEHSIWYHNNASVYNNEFTPYELNSTRLDNIFRAAYSRYPDITAMYVGMNNGLFRVYPEERLDSIVLSSHLRKGDVDYNCSSLSSNMSRYEHRCHIWYNRAFHNQHSVIFGQLQASPDRGDPGGGGEGGGGGGGGGFSPEAHEDTPQEGVVTILTLSKSLHDASGNFIGVLAIDVKV